MPVQAAQLSILLLLSCLPQFVPRSQLFSIISKRFLNIKNSKVGFYFHFLDNYIFILQFIPEEILSCFLNPLKVAVLKKMCVLGLK